MIYFNHSDDGLSDVEKDILSMNPHVYNSSMINVYGIKDRPVKDAAGVGPYPNNSVYVWCPWVPFEKLQADFPKLNLIKAEYVYRNTPTIAATQTVRKEFSHMLAQLCWLAHACFKNKYYPPIRITTPNDKEIARNEEYMSFD